MKKIIVTTILLILTTAACLTGCAPAATPAQDSLTVYASFYPVYDFAVKIAGDKAQVYNMVPAGSGGHGWEPSAQDIVALEKAQVFLYAGAGMEDWVDTVLGSLTNKNLTVVEAAQGLSLLDGHSHSDHEEAASHDPHVWLSPANAKHMIRNIADGLISVDPDNSAYYEENYTKYAQELDVLDQEFKDRLSPLPRKEIVVSHQAFGYLCRDYGLTQIAVRGISPDAEPDPRTMAHVIDYVKEHDVKIIFFEELVDPKVSQAIADATGAGTMVLSPIEALNDEQTAAGGDYFSVMRENLEALAVALS